MKKQTFLILAFALVSISASGQKLPPAPPDKSVIYFVRPSSAGFAVNFSYFDSTKLIGVFNGPKYIRYECEPGRHLFWARSENRDFVEAEVEAGKIYFLEAIVKMGAFKAAVELSPVSPGDKKRMDKIFKLINKKPSEPFSDAKESLRFKDVVDRGMEKYTEEKSKGVVNTQLPKSMYYENN